MAPMEILDPTVEPRQQPLTYVPRPDSLKGKRIGLVENTKFNSDRLLEKIGGVLKAEYGAAETRMWRKRNASVSALFSRPSRRRAFGKAASKFRLLASPPAATSVSAAS